MSHGEVFIWYSTSGHDEDGPLIMCIGGCAIRGMTATICTKAAKPVVCLALSLSESIGRSIVRMGDSLTLQ